MTIVTEGKDNNEKKREKGRKEERKEISRNIFNIHNKEAVVKS